MTIPQLLELLKGVELPSIPSTSGTNAYAAVLEDYNAYKAGQLIIVRFTNGNTGASTLNINGLGAVSIVRNGTVALLSGDIVAGATHLLAYNGTRFELLSQGAKLTALQMATSLTGYYVGSNAAISASDTLLGALGKIQGQLNAKGTSNLALTSAITGYSVKANTALSASDSILNALGKLQGQINARLTSAVKSRQTGSATYNNSTGQATAALTTVDVNKVVPYLSGNAPISVTAQNGSSASGLQQIGNITASSIAFGIWAPTSVTAYNFTNVVKWTLLEFF